MIHNPHDPREYDAVLGGQSLMPTNAAVLGGIAGVKRRLASDVIKERIAALADALKYGEAGLDLVIGALQDKSQQVEIAAYRLLRNKTEPRVRQILQEYKSWRFWVRSYDLNKEDLPEYVNVIAIAPDGQTFVSGSDGDPILKVWDLYTGELIGILEGHSKGVDCAAITPDGLTIVSGSSDKTIKIWNLHSGELSRTLAGHSDAVSALAIAPDGKTIVSSSYDLTINFWNLHTGELNIKIEGCFAESLAISADGKTLVSANENTIRVWNLLDGKFIRNVAENYRRFSSVAISQDAQIIMCGRDDYSIDFCNLYSGGGKWRSLQVNSFLVNALAISLDGQTLVTAGVDEPRTQDFRYTVKVWNLHTGELKKTFAGECYSAAISQDGQTLVTGSYHNITVRFLFE